MNTSFQKQLAILNAELFVAKTELTIAKAGRILRESLSVNLPYEHYVNRMRHAQLYAFIIDNSDYQSRC
ncbi:hypothetical protein HYP07_gp108 [Vibrio phage JSF3]|uniref:hypothetical protein n=1 Tax=Vibrio phage JSF3 TaxID=1916111 RepID=UPI000B60E319|nr:hypothetical protein HYP07_gp108 [Vibrio phage JSF3]APD18120.1 hypothetical protein [Vibrio phage JSF3]